jgi:hypothetical protein
MKIIYYLARARNTGLLGVLFIIELIAYGGGLQGLINLGEGILVSVSIFAKLLPFFKWDLVILLLKIIFGL